MSLLKCYIGTGQCGIGLCDLLSFDTVWDWCKCDIAQGFLWIETIFANNVASNRSNDSMNWGSGSLDQKFFLLGWVFTSGNIVFSFGKFYEVSHRLEKNNIRTIIEDTLYKKLPVFLKKLNDLSTSYEKKSQHTATTSNLSLLYKKSMPHTFDEIEG